MSKSKYGLRDTAEQVSEGIDLSGRLAIVTGASAGIGVETTRVLALRGADVLLAVRDVEKGEKIRKAIVDESAGKISSSQLEVWQLELSSFQSVRQFVEKFLATHNKLDLLINNAGIMGLPEGTRAEGYEIHFTTNHLGHFLLTLGLAPALVAAAPSRVINVSSRAHRFGSVDLEDINFEKKPYDNWQAYGQSKTANILFTRELNRRLSSKGVEAFSLHPGVIFDTGIILSFSEEEKNAVKERLSAVQLKTVAQGASTTVYAATSPDIAGKGGEYLEDNDLSSNHEPVPNVNGQWPHSKDDELAAKLWDLSEKITGASLSV